MTAAAAGKSATKRRKLSDQSDSSDHQPLLPGLPDHIAQLCLSRVRPSTLFSVSRSWRRVIYTPSFPPFFSLYALLLPTQITSDHQTHPIEFSSFDPISSRWDRIPPPPPPLRPILRRHPSFLSRNLPIQSVTVSGNLVLLAATADNLLPALPRPLVFDPISQNWGFGPSLRTPRRWCTAGASGDTVFVASGIGSHYTTDAARSVERWDLRNNRRGKHGLELGGNWEKLGAMRDGKFSRDAIDGVGWRGKLCMVNVKGDSAKEGVVYDVDNDHWAEMPEGMLAGWRGPAAAMDEGTLFAVDEAKGVLRRYDGASDRWEEVVAEVRLRGAERMAAAGGRVCVVCGGGGGIVVVDVVASPPRLWVVDTPADFEAVDIHILPRMSRSDL
ncbi:F-box/kelch-repeat protein SKIP25-like [Actinidia eriantha]|uniref:F-box/kelch-repeat protein SKIP25-like n=1 Tax=Actinidia eriantha TaxID=165200 RepID=UPI00258867CD|nr:F-box/kelch-repeat protein SKIP25-like [Actinidia eriantha]